MDSSDIRTDDAFGSDTQQRVRKIWLPQLTLYNISLSMIIVIVCAACLAPFITPYDPLHQDISQLLKGPSWAHWLGTDKFGRDNFSRIIFGLRASLTISGAAVAVALFFGAVMGLLAAYYRGWIDRVIMRLMDVLFAFPVMLLAIGVIALLGKGSFSTAAAIAIVYTPIFSRILRAPALVIASSDYVLNARSIGASDLRIILIHILPNLASVILVQVSLLLSSAILVEASLSFLGLGTQPPVPSLGMMLSEGRGFLFISPWTAIFSGLAILIVAFALNLFGDAMRDTLDPRLRQN